MELGRLDEETTANVGVIEGGTASNIVAGHCRILGEARSIDSDRAASTVGAMVDACTWAATEHGCDVDVAGDRDVPRLPGRLGLASRFDWRSRPCSAAGSSRGAPPPAAAATPTP